MDNKEFRSQMHRICSDVKPIYTETATWNASSQKWDANLSSILTKLIQDTGRFTESYASDLFITWDTIEHLLDTHPELMDEKHRFQIFGIRKCGVDGNSYVASRLADEHTRIAVTNDYYRRIYAVEWYPQGKDALCIMLKDVQNSMYQFGRKPTAFEYRLPDGSWHTAVMDMETKYGEPMAHITMPDGSEAILTHKSHDICHAEWTIEHKTETVTSNCYGNAKKALQEFINQYWTHDNENGDEHDKPQ